MKDNTIICRCSDITQNEIEELIKKGYITLDEIKRISRAGMGPCQGRTCEQLILQELAKYTSKNISELKRFIKRPPVKSVKLGIIAKGCDEFD